MTREPISDEEWEVFMGEKLPKGPIVKGKEKQLEHSLTTSVSKRSKLIPQAVEDLLDDTDDEENQDEESRREEREAREAERQRVLEAAGRGCGSLACPGRCRCATRRSGRCSRAAT